MNFHACTYKNFESKSCLFSLWLHNTISSYTKGFLQALDDTFILFFICLSILNWNNYIKCFYVAYLWLWLTLCLVFMSIVTYKFCFLGLKYLLPFWLQVAKLFDCLKLEESVFRSFTSLGNNRKNLDWRSHKWLQKFTFYLYTFPWRPNL